MVTIKVGDDLLFSSTLQHLKYVVQDITLRKELNQADTLEMIVPDINVRKSLLQVGTKEITLWVNNVRRFRGRLITKGMDFNKSLRIYCEGELAYLRDITIHPYKGNYNPQEYLQTILDEYNERLDGISDWKKFTRGRVTVTGESQTKGNEDYPTAFDELTEWLVNQYGGYLIPRYENGVNYLDYVDDEGDGAQSVVYGKNLLDYKTDSDYSPLYTRIIAIGSKPESSGGTSTGGENVPTPGDNDVPSPGADEVAETPAASEDTPPPVAIVTASDEVLQQYGLIETVKNYDECTTVAALDAAARADLAQGVTFAPTLEINALDMANFDGSQPFDIGKKYRLISPAHGYTAQSDKVLLVRLEEYPLQPEERNVYTFGAITKGLTGETVSTNRSVNAVAKLAVNTAAETQELLAKAKELADLVDTLDGKVSDVANYITAESTTDGWNIRTWKNGKIDAWATKSATGLSFTNGVATKTFTLPTGAPVSGVITITGDKFANYTGAIASGVLTVTIKAVEIFTAATLNITIKGV